MIIERRIKDLSFALEALSRVNSYSARTMCSELEGLLEKEIEVAKKQQVAREESNDTPTVAGKPLVDDEIPF